MDKAFLGIEPIIYIKDNSKITLYSDLNTKDYAFEDISQAKFIFSQDDGDTCIYYNCFGNSALENKYQNVETYYDDELNRLCLTINFGSANTDTSCFELNKPIRFEIATDVITLEETDDGDGCDCDCCKKTVAYSQTYVEHMPNIIITQGDSASLYSRMQSAGGCN